MKIYNATIKDVAIGLYGNNKRFGVKLVFCDQENIIRHTFELTDWTAVSQLTTLMNFLEISDLKDLEGKNIRVVVSNGLFRGFGHPEKDRFMAISYFAGRCPMTLNAKEFEEMLKNHLDYWH